MTQDPFPNRRVLAQFEGGCIWEAEKDGSFYIITDEGEMADFLVPGEDDDLRESLHSVRAFSTVEERETYVIQRGWHRFRRGSF